MSTRPDQRNISGSTAAVMQRSSPGGIGGTRSRAAGCHRIRRRNEPLVGVVVENDADGFNIGTLAAHLGEAVEYDHPTHWRQMYRGRDNSASVLSRSRTPATTHDEMFREPGEIPDDLCRWPRGGRIRERRGGVSKGGLLSVHRARGMKPGTPVPTTELKRMLSCITAARMGVS